MEPTDDLFGAISRLLQTHKLGRDVDAIIVDSIAKQREKNRR